MLKFTMINVKANSRLDNNTLFIEKQIASYLGLQNKKRIQLFVGQGHKSLILHIGKSEKKKNDIALNPEVMKKLYLASGKSYGVRIDKDEVHIGPVVGIMAETYNDGNKPFGEQTFFIKQLLNAGKQLGEICFAFNPYSVNWKKENIHAYTYGKSGWRKGVFPIPDIIYPRAKGYSSPIMTIRNRFEKMGVTFLNPSLIGKWQTYRIISQNPSLLPYIPDTRLIRSFSQIDKMINKYRAVYLKPVSGSQGQNIIKIVKSNKSSAYQYQYQLNHKTFKGRASDLGKLQYYLKRVMGNRTYIIQKQINLLKLDGNLIDVRVLVQKDHTGIWDITGMACRVGKNGSITSNICSGGKGQKVEEILKRQFPDAQQRDEIIEKVKFVAIEGAKTLEKSIGASAEMGVDIGIDQSGSIWFIEANIKPGRQIFNLIGEKETRKKSVERPLLYARYLAGF